RQQSRTLRYPHLVCLPQLVYYHHIILCEKKRRRPRSTRYPYTTLFRSGIARSAERCSIGWCVGPSSPRPIESCVQMNRFGTCCRDRKSTRLNSSHVSSSYAVFCLKKKMRACS